VCVHIRVLVIQHAKHMHRIILSSVACLAVPCSPHYFINGPDRPWGPPTLLYNGYWVCFTRLKRPGRGVNHSPQSSAVVLEWLELNVRFSKKKKFTNYKMCLDFLCIFFFVWNISHFKKNSARYYHTCTQITTQVTFRLGFELLWVAPDDHRFRSKHAAFWE
jgi:hypothetical protein